MFCFLYKWMISWRLDSGKALPGFINRHINRCGTCREFARVSASLGSRLVEDAGKFLQPPGNALEEKIISALDTNPLPRFTSGRKFSFRPIPALAAAMVVVVVIIGIYIQISSPSPVNDNIFQVDLSETVFVKNPLEVIEQVESPIESEMNSLGQSIHSAAKSLVSSLDFKIGQR